MRLFIAVDFSSDIKQKLNSAKLRWENQAISGSFTRPENFHITVVFLGECSNPTPVCRAMDSIKSQPFALKMNGFGCFSRGRGKIIYVNIQKAPELLSIHRQLCNSLESAGFSIEKRKFTPHLTLGRQVIMPEESGDAFIKEFKLEAAVDGLSLMKSERINGVLTYTPIYIRNFPQDS